LYAPVPDLERGFLQSKDPLRYSLSVHKAARGRAAMDERLFDDLAKRLGVSRVPRRRALKSLGATAFVVGVLPLLPKQAEALSRTFRRRCRSVGGVPLRKGECHCAETCSAPNSALFVCHSNNSCYCEETVAGKGFCADFSTGAAKYGCSTNADCPSGTVCLLPRGCPGNSCTSSGDCPSNYACIKGTCQETRCYPPCPT
jgi:hypothetical protein